MNNNKPNKNKTYKYKFKKKYSLKTLTDINNNNISYIHPLNINLTYTQLNIYTKKQKLNKYYQYINKYPVNYYRRNKNDYFQLPINI